MPPFRGGAQLRLPGAGRSPGPQIAGSAAGGHAEGHLGSRNSRNLALSRHPPRRTLRAPGKGCAKPRGRDAFRIKGKRSKIRFVPVNAAAQRTIEAYLARARHRTDLEGPLFRPIENNRTGRLDACRSLYWRSRAQLPTGHPPWPIRRGTCLAEVLQAREMAR